MIVDLAQLVGASHEPLVVVGSAKNVGKTVTLNRLHAEGRLAGQGTFARVSAGWDGEDSDHLTQTPKPRIRVEEGDVVLTMSRLFEAAEARFELLEAASATGPLGRLAIGRCVRAGYVELAGPGSRDELGVWIRRLAAYVEARVLIDGAADRQSPLAACPEAEVGLALAPLPREDVETFVARAAAAAARFALPVWDGALPHVAADGFSYLLDGDWRALSYAEILQGRAPCAVPLFVGGPLTDAGLARLHAWGASSLIVRDPTHLFLSSAPWRAHSRRAGSLYLARRPALRFVSVRLEGEGGWGLAPATTLARLRAVISLPCFDPWFAEAA